MGVLIYFFLLIVFVYNTFKYLKLDYIMGLILTVYTYFLFLFLLNNMTLYVLVQEAKMATVFAEDNAKTLTSNYILIFSLIFLFLFRLMYKYIFKNERIQVEKDEINNRLIYRKNNFQIFSVVLLYIFSFIYIRRSFDINYLDYVAEIKAWDKTFFFASSIVPLFFLYTGRVSLGLISSFTFIIVAYNTTVRSFLLLGSAPFFFYLFYLYRKNIKNYVFITFLPLVFIFYIVYFVRNQNLMLDFLLPTYAEIIFNDHNAADMVNQNFPSIKTFFEELLRPFLLLIKYDFGPKIYDTPYYFGEIIMGYVGINHFPSTLFAESWVLYSWHGVYIYPILFLFFTFLIRYLIYNFNLFVLFFPYLIWFVYNFIRGTMTISVVPFSYAFYISFIFLIFPSIISSSNKNKLLG